MHSLTDFGLSADALSAIFLLSMLFALILEALSLVFFFLRALGIYDMATRAGQKNPWFAFVPFLNYYAFGQLAGRYVGKNGKKATGFGTAMVVLYSLVFVLMLVSAGMFGDACIRVLFRADAVYADGGKLAASDFASIWQAFIPMILLYVAALICRIVELVCAYRIFAVFDFKNAVAYTVLSVFFSFLLPIFLFTVRKKEPVFSYAERFEQFANFNFGA